MKRSLSVIPMACMALLFLSGCQHKMRNWTGALKPKAFRQISLGMSKDMVVQKIGDPNIVRGSITNKFGQTIEVWEYRVGGSNYPLTHYLFEQDYFLYFHDNKLVQWGTSGDWKQEATHIQEIRYR
jgi:outer membrane protein assembly factor BamE (lipoprotein component of BamABCDE complex)